MSKTYTNVMDITYLKYENGYASGQPGYVEPTPITVRGTISRKPDALGYFTIKSKDLKFGQARAWLWDITDPAPLVGKGYPLT